MARNRQPKELTQKSLKRLKRSELLEIMLAQSEEIDRLRAELEQKEHELADKAIAIQNAGSIAEASLKLTHIFEEAQKAVDLYAANITAGAAQKPVRHADARVQANDDAMQDAQRLSKSYDKQAAGYPEPPAEYAPKH